MKNAERRGPEERRIFKPIGDVAGPTFLKRGFRLDIRPRVADQIGEIGKQRRRSSLLGKIVVMRIELVGNVGRNFLRADVRPLFVVVSHPLRSCAGISDAIRRTGVRA